MTKAFLRALIRLYGHHAPIQRGKYKLALWAFQHLRPVPSPAMARLGAHRLVEIDPSEFVQKAR